MRIEQRTWVEMQTGRRDKDGIGREQFRSEEEAWSAEAYTNIEEYELRGEAAEVLNVSDVHLARCVR